MGTYLRQNFLALPFSVDHHMFVVYALCFTFTLVSLKLGTGQDIIS